MGTFDSKRLKEEERYRAGELYDWKAPERRWEGEQFYFTTHFDTFSVDVAQDNIGQPIRGLTFERGGRKFDALSLLPEEYKLVIGFTLAGIVEPRRKMITVPKLETKGAVLSALHEFSHANRFSAMAKEQLDQILSVTNRYKDPHTSNEDRKIVLEDERLAWEKAKAFIEEIEEKLSTTLFKDKDMVEEYIRVRLRTYESHIV